MGPPPKKFRGQKLARFGVISDDFKLRQRISLEWMKIFKIGWVSDLQRFLACTAKKKFCEPWSANYGDLPVKSYPPKSTFSEDRISSPRGCCAPKFLHALENDPSFASASPIGNGGPPYNFFTMWGRSKISLKFIVLAARTLEPGEVASWNFSAWCAAR